MIRNKRILITGCSFIGAHLIRKLIEKQPKSIRVINLTERHFINLKSFKDEIEFLTRDLRELDKAKKSVKGIDVVFHLAADHGGRGYVELKQGQTATNFLLDGSVFKACLEEGVEKVFYASSACVYPNYLQNDIHKKNYLKENDVGPPYDADNIYGWAKLMGELVLKQYYKDYGLKSAIGRFFTVYGPYADETHAIMATIAKAFIRQDPFEVWGDGRQIRNWTYVEDIVEGIILAVEKIDDATVVNFGTEERIKVSEMVNLVLKFTDYNPKKIIFQKSKPTGPMNRVADISLAKKLLGWQPNWSFKEGLKITVDWYFKNKNKEAIKKNLKNLLI